MCCDGAAVGEGCPGVGQGTKASMCACIMCTRQEKKKQKQLTYFIIMSDSE